MTNINPNDGVNKINANIKKESKVNKNKEVVAQSKQVEASALNALNSYGKASINFKGTNKKNDLSQEVINNRTKRLTAMGIDELLINDVLLFDKTQYSQFESFLNNNIDIHSAIMVTTLFNTKETNEFINLINRNYDSEAASFFLCKHRNTPEKDFNDSLDKYMKKYNDLINMGFTKSEAAYESAKIDCETTLSFELQEINKKKYKPVQDGFIDKIGKEFCIGKMPNISDNFSLINIAKYGPRIDKSLENWTIKIGNKNIKIRTDNNIVSKKNVTSDMDLSKIIIIDEFSKENLEYTLKNMQIHNQELPEEIFITNLIGNDIRLINKPAGLFDETNPNKIFIHSKIFQKDVEQTERVIYHECTHMSDYNLRKNKKFFSLEKFSIINKKNEIIGTKKNKIKAKNIEHYIGKYALTNPREFIAEVTKLITEGTIVLDKNNLYTINTEGFPFYTNADGILTEYNNNDKSNLNEIMSLYIELTEDKIAKAQTIS